MFVVYTNASILPTFVESKLDTVIQSFSSNVPFSHSS